MGRIGGGVEREFERAPVIVGAATEGPVAGQGLGRRMAAGMCGTQNTEWLGIVAERGTNEALGRLDGFLARLCA